jgi:hypothetical protein
MYILEIRDFESTLRYQNEFSDCSYQEVVTYTHKIIGTFGVGATYTITQTSFDNNQFLIDNSEGTVEVDAQVLRGILIEKLKVERELKVLKEKFEKLEASREYLQNVVFNIQLKAHRFIDLSVYSITE